MSIWTRFAKRTAALALVPLAAACGPLEADDSRDGTEPNEERFAELAAGTGLTIETSTELDTRTATVGSPVSGYTVRPIVYEGVTVIPMGSPVNGTVTSISQDPPRVSMSFTDVVIHGTTRSIQGTVSGVPLVVRSEMKDEVAKIGGGAGAGALLGGVIGGDAKSAAIGAAAGAAAGTGVALATKERWAVLPVATELSVLLETSLRLPLRPADQPTPLGWVR